MIDLFYLSLDIAALVALLAAAFALGVGCGLVAVRKDVEKASASVDRALAQFEEYRRTSWEVIAEKNELIELLKSTHPAFLEFDGPQKFN